MNTFGNFLIVTQLWLLYLTLSLTR